MTDLYRARQRSNACMVFLCLVAATIGLLSLMFILAALVSKGITGLSLTVFTQNTPGPGSEGGLLNAIFGSLLLTSCAVIVGTPIGLLAGTWMAEYGHDRRITHLIRFINDILLSAPSIIIGLFIYEMVVVPMGHFSGLAGVLALALIAIPITIRTSEDMLLLVPSSLREAASALGLPRYYVITRVTYRAAKTGLMTGVLLATARISGETAPLLFTTLSSPYFSLDLTKEMANLPVIISNFAGSPYDNWQALAWTGAFLITCMVLLLAILARVVSADRSAKR